MHGECTKSARVKHKKCTMNAQKVLGKAQKTHMDRPSYRREQKQAMERYARESKERPLTNQTNEQEAYTRRLKHFGCLLFK